jgi:hypothetical protein
MAPELLCLRGMSTTRLASLLSLLAGSLVSGTLLGCSGAVDATSDGGIDDDGCGGWMGEGGHVDAGKGDGEAGAACVTPTPISVDDVLDTACLADMQKSCAGPLAACAQDCACSGLAVGCLNTSVELGVVECLSAAEGPVENQLFNCIYFSGPCNDAKAGHGADAGAGD